MQLLKSLQTFGLWFDETARSQITGPYIPLWALTHRSNLLQHTISTWKMNNEHVKYTYIINVFEIFLVLKKILLLT